MILKHKEELEKFRILKLEEISKMENEIEKEKVKFELYLRK